MDMRDPMTVIRSYLRATYARDFAAAYRFISAEDRKVRDSIVTFSNAVLTAASYSMRRASSANLSKSRY